MTERQPSEEVKLGEARAPYIVGQETEEEIRERIRIQFPPYFERFLDERDRRISAELRRIEEAVEQVRRDIARTSQDIEFRLNVLMEFHRTLDAKVDRLSEELRAEMDRRFEEQRVEMDRRFGEQRAEMDRRFGEQRAEMDRRHTELAEGLKSLRAEMDRRFEEQRAEMDRRHTELAEGLKSLRAEMDRRFEE
ncbi:MAG: hypothetical protein N3B68_05635, partial [Anaerolineae bacterium]|nr:hypothetical protein [Anaerolineae bacterium]